MQHAYTSNITWTGNQGTGTFGLQGLCPDLGYRGKGKEPIHCSNDPLLGGDPGKMNPEDLLLSSLSLSHAVVLTSGLRCRHYGHGISGLAGGNG
jgi:organic hydroperoxide reductase OsmC/OhrA